MVQRASMKRYLVTGASAGLGEALVRRLVADGGVVWGVARRMDAMTKLQAELPPGRFFVTACDVTSAADVDAALAAMAAEDFVPDVAILNAGVNIADLEPDFDLRACEQVFRVNLFGALIWVERLLPGFLKAGAGHFVAISSMSAFRPSSHGTAYAASKAALSMAFESLRMRYRESPLRFTTVHLGPVDTAMWPGGRFPLLLSPDDAARRILDAVARGRAVYDCPAPLVLLARLSRLMPRSLAVMAERLARRAPR